MNAKGFGLIQVMIAVALTSIVALGIAQIMVAQSNQISYSEDRLSRMNLEKDIRELFEENGANCTLSLAGVKLKKKGRTPVVLKTDDKSFILEVANANNRKYDKLEIKELYVEDIDVFDNGGSDGKILLVVGPERIREGGGPSKLKPIELKIQVSVNPSNDRITACIEKTVSNSACVIRDTKEYGSSSAASGSFKIPNETEVVRLLLSSEARTVEFDRCDKDYSCTIPRIDMIIYPGVTKVGSTSFPKGDKLKKVRTLLGTKSQETCSGNGKPKMNYYRTEYYYGGTKLLTITDNINKHGVGCKSYNIHKAALNTNTLPPLCPIRSGQSSSSLPTNYNFELYKPET